MRNAGIAYPGTFIIVLAFAYLTGGSARAESQYLVVAAEPKSTAVEIGKVLVVGDTLTVPDGVTVTLMGENGSVNTLTGPTAVVVTEDAGSAAAVDDNRSTLSKLGELLKSDKNTADRLGVSRSARAGAMPDPWAIPLDAKTACVRDSVLKLKREEDAGRELALSLEVDGEMSSALVWAADAAVFEFPQKLPPETKSVRVKVGEGFSEMAIIHLPATVDPGPSIETLGLLNRSGCTEQMLALAKSLAG